MANLIAVRQVINFGILLGVVACSAQSELEAKAKEAIKYQMKDPESAEFREVRVYPEKNLVCGEVNAKNSFGAYGGFEPFSYDDGQTTIGSIEEVCIDAMVENTIAIMKRAKQMKMSMPEGPERDKAIAEIEAQIEEAQKSLQK